MKVDNFSARFEATPRQMSYIAALVKKADTTLEAVLENLWGMSMSAAFSDRPWMRLTRREASKVIETLLAGTVKPDVAAEVGETFGQEEAQEERREAYKSVLDECPF
jgi:hypothetical protein